jgi:DNA adenine methylase
MTDDDHRELADVLHACQGQVVLSGYPSPLYDELYAGWRRVEFDIANHAAGGKVKERKRETLWMNRG